MKTLPLDKIAAFFAEAKKSGVYEMYLLEIATGLRQHDPLSLQSDFVNIHADPRSRRQKLQRSVQQKNAFRKSLSGPSYSASQRKL